MHQCSVYFQRSVPRSALEERQTFLCTYEYHTLWQRIHRRFCRVHPAWFHHSMYWSCQTIPVSGMFQYSLVTKVYLVFFYQEEQDGVFANVCALEHLPYMEGYVLREPSILVPAQCIQAVVADMQTRAQSVFKYQDNDTLVELTGDVSACHPHKHGFFVTMLFFFVFQGVHLFVCASSFEGKVSAIWWHAGYHGSTHCVY